MQPDMRNVGRRIRELRRALGLNQEKFGRLVGFDQSTVSRWESDKNPPESEALLALASLAKTSVEEFLGQAELRPVETVETSVVGKVQAGEWVEALEWPHDEHYPLTVRPNARFPRGIRYFGLEVVGHSMNQIYPEGTILICAAIEEIGRKPETGEHVIVERRRGNGLIEATCKQYVEVGDRIWLRPQSDDPSFQAFELSAAPPSKDIEEIRILAIVTASIRQE